MTKKMDQGAKDRIQGPARGIDKLELIIDQTKKSKLIGKEQMDGVIVYSGNKKKDDTIITTYTFVAKNGQLLEIEATNKRIGGALYGVRVFLKPASMEAIWDKNEEDMTADGWPITGKDLIKVVKDKEKDVNYGKFYLPNESYDFVAKSFGVEPQKTKATSYNKGTSTLYSGMIQKAKNIIELEPMKSGKYAKHYRYVVVTANNKKMEVYINQTAPHTVYIDSVEAGGNKNLYTTDNKLKRSEIALIAQEFIDALDNRRVDLEAITAERGGKYYQRTR